MDDGASSCVKTEILCKVCGDKASGKHYGVASCDGCRGFFKRSIRRNLEYICKENGRCVVDVTRRNQCQACRFRKCLQVNMKKDAVQHERAPRSCIPHHHHHQTSPQVATVHHLLHQPFPGAGFARRLHNSIFAGLPLPISAHPTFVQNHPTLIADHGQQNGTRPTNPYIGHGFLYPSMFGLAPKPFGNSIVGVGTDQSAVQQQQQKVHLGDEPLAGSRSREASAENRVNGKDDEVSSSEEAGTAHNGNGTVRKSESTELSENERTLRRHIDREIDPATPLTLNRPFDISCISLLPAENIYESAAKLLFLSVKWARTIPSFLQLSYRDQNVLLEESWSELFILTASQWALPIDERLLVNNAIAPASRHMALEEDAKRLRETILRLSMLRVDHTEYACLKALVLFKAELPTLCDPTHVELLQDQTHVMLQEYCTNATASSRIRDAATATTHPSGAARFGKLLLALPAVKSISKRSLEDLLFRKTVGDVAIERLLIDMLKTSAQSL